MLSVASATVGSLMGVLLRWFDWRVSTDWRLGRYRQDGRARQQDWHFEVVPNFCEGAVFLDRPSASARSTTNISQCPLRERVHPRCLRPDTEPCSQWRGQTRRDLASRLPAGACLREARARLGVPTSRHRSRLDTKSRASFTAQDKV